MAKKIKESHPFSIRMDKAIFERLNEFCEKVGQSKTVAIERAIDKYIDAYEEQMKKLEKIK